MLTALLSAVFRFIPLKRRQKEAESCDVVLPTPLGTNPFAAVRVTKKKKFTILMLLLFTLDGFVGAATKRTDDILSNDVLPM